MYIDVQFSGTHFASKSHNGYESRNEATTRMLQTAWNTWIRNGSSFYPTVKTFRIHTGDGFDETADMSYAIDTPGRLDRCMPSFVFDSWPEVGIDTYSAKFNQMIEASKQPHQFETVFWIGANTNQTRVDGCELASAYPDRMDFRMMKWNRQDPKSLHTHTPDYVSLVDHCKYRVLIDMGAGGFSGRLPLLFASGRPLILTTRRLENWFYWNGTLIPWVHYIPCDGSKTGILEAVDWTFSHKEEANQIGLQGQDYARTYLTHDAAIRRCAEILVINYNRK
jgi:hypothetical protein